MDQSNLSDIGINLTYTKGMPVEYFRYHGHAPATSYTMLWCMLATGFSRIFTKEDMKEFLFRLTFALNSMNLVETWLMKDHLMDFKVKGKTYVLNLDDIVMHLGIEVIDSIENHSAREKYLSGISGGIATAMLLGGLEDFSILEPVIEDNIIQMKQAKELIPEVTPELLAKAEFFVSDLMKFIPEEAFTDRNPLIAEKEQEIEHRRDRIRNLPVFDIRKIPRRIIRDWVHEIFKPEDATKLLQDKKEFDKHVKPYVYLSWLMAKDLIIMNGPFTCAKEGVALNYEDYELTDGGFRLDMTIEEYALEDLATTIEIYFMN